MARVLEVEDVGDSPPGRRHLGDRAPDGCVAMAQAAFVRIIGDRAEAQPISTQ